MSFEDLASSLFNGFAPEMFDFDLFDKDQDAVETEFALNNASFSPASGNDYGSPKSTESEQSEALDIPDVDKEIEGLSTGIIHDHTDIFKRDSPLLDQSFLSHDSLLSDPTMMSTFPGLSDSVDLLGLLNTALGQANNHYEAPLTTTSAQPEVTFGGISPEWLSTVSSPVLSSPSAAQLPISQPSTKRKATEDGDVSVTVKKPRGRPPKAKVTSPTPSRRPSNPSPLSKTVTFPEDDASSDTGSTKHTVSGESSTARPKAVVPLKYLKDPKSVHSAQMILGMSAEQILSYATFDLLLRDVDPSRLEAAEEFGEKLAGGRDKAAKDAARARADRKNKVETLERQVAGLESKLIGVQAFLQGLVSQGFVSADQVALLMA